MVILSDILLFITTALVLSVTILGIVLRVRVDDSFTGSFLLVLVPLSLQMCLTLLSNYLGRTLTDVQLASFPYHIYALGVTIFSIILTTTILLMMSRYLIMLLPATEEQKILGNRLLTIFISLFFLISLWVIIAKSRGNWLIAHTETMQYHFFAGSMFLVIHGIIALVYVKKATTYEEERLLKGIISTFLPLLVLFPLDLLFFRESYFKLVYLSFAILAAYLYYFISRRYILTYEQADVANDQILKQYGISDREAEIIGLLIEGLSNQQIAKQLYISPNTVKTHIKNIYAKVGVNNRLQLFSLLKQ
ncbi:MAG TPA: helix-turn-helix transcriptional regulator [Sphaerochaeta sp.]|nr:helix-turn-helix transcriptional regulator [Sphaerochaeta sp.]